MSLDLIRRRRQAFPRTQSGNGGTTTNNGVIRIPLDKTWLLEKLAVNIGVTQTFTGAPTSSDVRRFFKQIQLVVDKGDGMKMNFHAAYDLFRMLNPQAPAPVVALGTAASANFTFEVNFAQLMAIASLSTALLSGKYSTLSLELTVNDDANNGFVGGTVPGVASYVVQVMPWELRDQTPADRASMAENWGLAERVIKQLENQNVTQAGMSTDVLLTGGGKIRFILMHFFDAASNGNLTDAVINNGATISMEVDGFKYYENTPLAAIKQVNAQRRNMPGTGVLLLDFGDDPLGWAETRGIKDVKFHLDVPASANLPAAGRIEVCQDYTKGLEKLPPLLRA